MKMTLEEAKFCISQDGDCKDCRFNHQAEIECRREACEIAVSCINYCLVGKKLINELEEKER